MDKAGKQIDTTVTGESSGIPTLDVSLRHGSRRSFLSQAISAASGLVLSELAFLSRLDAAAPPCTVTSPCSASPPPWKPGDPLQEVAEFRSKNGKLLVEITVTDGPKKVAIFDKEGYYCCSKTLRYYQGHDLNSGTRWPPHLDLPAPGPTLRARVGDTVEVRLLNDIKLADFPRTTPNDMACDAIPGNAGQQIYPRGDTAPSCFHGDNLTNLHYHGSHVSPDGHGDNVMIDVAPRTQRDVHSPVIRGEFINIFTLPVGPSDQQLADSNKPISMGQAPGTHWYHAHKHGSVALQLLNGMAGAFVIEGEFDDQLEKIIPGLRRTEKVLVVQQIGDQIYIQPTGTPMQTGISPNPPYPLPIVNGQVSPTITMAPGEIQRWRFVNATMSQTAWLTYEFQPVNGAAVPEIRQIAYDGVQLAPENYINSMFGQAQQFTLDPGSRIDILVKAPGAGQANLVFRPVYGEPAPLNTLLHVNVTGSPVNGMSFPDQNNYPKMPGWLVWDENDRRNRIVGTRNITFDREIEDPAKNEVGRPSINQVAYNGEVSQAPHLHTAEQWILTNLWDDSIHTFHIHVNPFQVMEIYDPRAQQQVMLKPPYVWRDTIAIPASETVSSPPSPGSHSPLGSVKIRTRYTDFTGAFVLHCHILDHEDRGMMEKVVIIDPKLENPPHR